MAIIYLARHATPRWDLTDIPYFVQPGPPLSSMGIVEAMELAQFFKMQSIQYCFTSPLVRASTTARMTAELCSVPLEVRNGLHESEPGETDEDKRVRLIPVVEEAFRLSGRIGPVVLFSHGGPINRMLLECGLTEEILSAYNCFDHKNIVSTAGVWKIESQPDGRNRFEMVFAPTTQGLPAAFGSVYS